MQEPIHAQEDAHQGPGSVTGGSDDEADTPTVQVGLAHIRSMGGGALRSRSRARPFWPPPLVIPPHLDECDAVPSAFRCPITYDVFREPAHCQSGVLLMLSCLLACALQLTLVVMDPTVGPTTVRSRKILPQQVIVFGCSPENQ